MSKKDLFQVLGIPENGMIVTPYGRLEVNAITDDNVNYSFVEYNINQECSIENFISYFKQ